ncbi:BON domain-containing protein [Micromonospora sp. NPDC023956]|uniref:BON domain-containing protein n=1 Tax=Micromonospora sp. NPDC023956 TaxID=3155722 RepID=UPI0033F61FA9
MVLPWPLPDENAHPFEPFPTPPTDDDTRLAVAVTRRLLGNRLTRRQRITVEVQNRVVILAGTVETPDVRFTAGELAWGAAGVADVCNALRLANRHRPRR